MQNIINESALNDLVESMGRANPNARVRIYHQGFDTVTFSVEMSQVEEVRMYYVFNPNLLTYKYVRSRVAENSFYHKGPEENARS